MVSCSSVLVQVYMYMYNRQCKGELHCTCNLRWGMSYYCTPKAVIVYIYHLHNIHVQYYFSMHVCGRGGTQSLPRPSIWTVHTCMYNIIYITYCTIITILAIHCQPAGVTRVNTELAMTFPVKNLNKLTRATCSYFCAMIITVLCTVTYMYMYMMYIHVTAWEWHYILYMYCQCSISTQLF